MRPAAIYRALLCCYPGPFRDEYGRDMVDAFVEQLRDARQHGGRRAQASVWLGTLYDLVFTAFREHCHVIQQDLRHAARILVANPGFAAVAVLSLALGIGANTAIFSLLNNVMMSPLPVRNPQELVMLTNPDSSGVQVGSARGERALLSYAEFRQLQDQTATFVSLMASQSGREPLQARVAGGEPEDIGIRMVSASYFTTLGVSPLVGRAFAAEDEQTTDAAPYAVISHDYWQRRFGGRADVLGQTIALRGGLFSIIGVMPPSFFGEIVGERPDAWVPLTMQAAVLPGRDWLHERPGDVEKVMWLHVFGRLRPGVTLDAAQANANVVFQQGLAAFYGSAPATAQRAAFLDQRLTLYPAATGASQLRGTFSEPLLVLLAAAGLVLLIACANLGNLLLARTTARHREMSVRLALGASRARLIRQLLTESLCLSAVGGLVGLGTAFLLREGLLRLVSDAIALPPALDIRVLGFVFALTLAAGLLLGLLPALRITKTDAAAGLKEQGRGLTGSAAWLRVGKFVVVGQLALSLPLLVGAGLLLRTLSNLQQADLGYPKEQVLLVRLDAQPAGYEPARQAAAFEQLLERIRALPGVRGATYSNNGLFAGSDSGDEIIVEGYTPKSGEQTGSRYDQVGPGYFSTLGIPIRLGREILTQDRAGGHMVCVINETFAKQFFEGRNPLGLHVTQVFADQRHTYEVVGVVRDSRQNRLRGEIEYRFYVPATQPSSALGSVTFAIRPSAGASSVVADVRRAVQQAEPGMTIVSTSALTDAVDRRIVQDRLLARLSIAFGIVAALLAAIGLYGVLSYGVARRTNEIGIRKALGAQQRTLIAMIARETGWLLVVGLIAGIALSVAGVRLITSRLYGLTSTDPAAFAVAIAALAAVAVLATWLPAYRASRVDPLVALRYE
jgi:predicted permease